MIDTYVFIPVNAENKNLISEKLTFSSGPETESWLLTSCNIVLIKMRKKWKREMAGIVFTCFFFSNESNVFSVESEILNVLPNVVFRNVLRKTANHDRTIRRHVLFPTEV